MRMSTAVTLGDFKLVSRLIIKSTYPDSLHRDSHQMVCINDDKTIIDKQTSISGSEYLDIKDVAELINERINLVLLWTLKALKLSKHDIKSIRDLLTIEDLSDQLLIEEDCAWVPVSIKIDTMQESENCKDLLMIAQNFCTKINVILFVCKGSNGLLCLNLKFSWTELMKDPLAIMARF